MASLLAFAKKNILQPVQHAGAVIGHDIAAAPQGFITHVAAPVDQAVTRSPIGRGAQTVALGALRSGVGTAQGLSGLYDLATPGVGTNRFSKSLNNVAKATDVTAKAEHSNPLLYHGTQAATDALTFAAGGAAAKAVGKIPTVAKATTPVLKTSAKFSAPVVHASEKLASKGVAGRVAARALQNTVKPGYQAANAGFTALQTGKTAAQGTKVTPGSVATNAAIGGLGFPVAGAITHEATAPLINKAVNQLRKTNIVRPSSLSNLEVAHLSQYLGSRGTNEMTPEVYTRGVAAAQKAGVNPTDMHAIDKLLGAHRTYATKVQQRVQALQAAHDKTIKFTQDHPLGMTSGAVDGQGNKLGLDGTPLQPAAKPVNYPQRLTDETDKAYLKRVKDTLPTPTHLPEAPHQYFDMSVPGATTVPMNKLVSTKTAEENIKGGTNSPKLMQAAADGQVAKRAPITVTPAPGGKFKILDGNGTYTGASKYGWQQMPVRVVSNEDVNAAHDLVSRATKANPAFQQQAKSIAGGLGLQYHEGPLKGFDRILEKGVNDYADHPTAAARMGQIKDSVRGMVEMTDPAKVNDIIDHFKKNADVVSVKNGYERPGPGYKDAKVIIRNKDGHLGEVIIATPEMIKAKEELGGHNLYEMARTTTDQAQFEQLNTKMNALYGAADAATAKRLASSADSSVPLSKARVGENGRPPGTVVPETLPPAASTRTMTSSTSKKRGYVNSGMSDVPSTTNIAQNGGEGKLNSVGDIAHNRVAALQKQRGRLAGQPPETPPLTTAKGNTGKTVENRLTTGGKEGRQNIGPGTQELISGKHVRRNTKALAARQESNVNNLSLDEAITQAHQKAAVPPGHLGEEDQTFIVKTIERADMEANKALAAGDQATYGHLRENAAALHNMLSRQGVTHGAASQALSILYKLSPQGLYYKATRDLERAGGKLTPELDTTLRQQADIIKKAPDQPAKDKGIAEFQKTVANALPQSTTDNILSVWKAGLLSGVKTQGGNFLSNATFGGLKKVSDIPSAAVDKGLSLVTKQRTKTLTNKGIASGTGQGIKTGAHTLKTGQDIRNAGDKYEQHADINFKNPVIQKVFGMPANYIFRGMNAADQPFYYAAFKNSVYDQAKAAGVTKGLKGSALTDYMAQTAKAPTEQIVTTAKQEADKAVLNYNTIASKAIQSAHTGIDHLKGITPAGKAAAHTALNVLAPFVRVPSAFLSRTIDFTPFGVGKEIFHQIAGKQFDQRALSQALGEGITGTGIIALGIALTQHNLLSGDYPQSDPKEAQRWKAEGITPNSVKLGGKWISLNYLGPLGLLFGAGHNLEHTTGGSAAAKTGAALAGFGQGLMNQSFLQGFSGFNSAITNPTQSAKNYINSEASSIIPALSNDVANITDRYQRQADTVKQSIENRIPGLRHNNPIKQDVYGNQLRQPSGMTGVVNPFKPSNSLSNPVTAEVGRLHTVDPNNSDLQVTPVPVKSSITVGNTSVHLTNAQRYDLQTKVGQAVQKYWGQLIQTSAYKQLGDIDKAKALSNLRTDIMAAQERQYVTANNLATYSKAPTKAVASIISGTIDPANYASKATTPASAVKLNAGLDGQSKALLDKVNLMPTTQRTQYLADPKNKLQYDTAQYQNNVANNKYSPVQQFSKQQSLAKESITANYDPKVTQLYNLSKANLSAYFAAHPEDQKLSAQILQLGDTLASNGLVTSNKFRTTNGTVSFTPATKKNTFKTTGFKTSKPITTPKFKSSIRVAKPPKVKLATKKLSVSKLPAIKAASSKAVLL